MARAHKQQYSRTHANTFTFDRSRRSADRRSLTFLPLCKCQRTKQQAFAALAFDALHEKHKRIGTIIYQRAYGQDEPISAFCG